MAKHKGGTTDAVYARDHKTCWICGTFVRREDATKDHYQTRSSGGYNKGTNYRLAHGTCNHARGSLPVEYVERIKQDNPGVSREAMVALLYAERENV